MLNELKKLADSIQAAGFSGEDWDDNFKPIKTTSPCFIISLSNEGEIVDIRRLEQEKSKALRTWQGGSLGETFPSFNFQPFYKLPKDDNLTPSQKKEAFSNLVGTVKLAESLPETIGSVKLQNREKADVKTAKCLGEIARKFFTIITTDVSEDDVFIHFENALKSFFTGTNKNFAETFNRKLATYLRSQLPKSVVPEQWDLWPILYATKEDVVLFFDLNDASDFSIASERGIKTINERLLSHKAVDSGLFQSLETDAFGLPVSQDELIEKLPEVKLPSVLANTKLRSMNGESKCQKRYGRIDAESYPVGREVRKTTKAAISWISSPEREGKTWAIAGSNELIFAYPKDMPPSPPPLARLLGNGRSLIKTNEGNEARFEKYAENALKGMKTLASTGMSNAEIEVFAIGKADKARRKVVFYRNYSLAKLDTAVSSWLAGADNIPPILLRKWPLKANGETPAKGKQPVPCEFHAPLPIISVKLCFTRWTYKAEEKLTPMFSSVSIYKRDKNDKEGKFPLAYGLELFLGESVVTSLAERMLSLILQGSSSLCIAAGNLAHKREVLSNARAVSHLEIALPLMGILLHKLNRTKENYMGNSPYLIGRFLNLADGLHAVWCRNVKEKDPLPPQLLGSSLFASFQLNPVQGFANAGMRIKPYIDWAKTNKTGDAALSRWFVGEFGRVTAAIEEAGIPSRLSDADKAEMLLGYLSSSRKDEVADATDIETSDIPDTL